MTYLFSEIFNKLTFIFPFYYSTSTNNHRSPVKILYLLGFCKHFIKNLPLLIFYFASTYLLPNIYNNSTSRISVPYHLIRVPYSATEASYCATSGFTTNNYTQHLFPRWEHFIPRLGILCSQGGNNC